MRKIYSLVLLATFVGILCSSASSAEPIKILFDTDMHTDCDDVGAMAVLHALADNGECEILATVVSSRDPWAPATVDAINTYYGRPDLPVGIVKGQGVLEKSKFTRRVGEEFPNKFKPGAEVPDALAVYRDTLERQLDGTVVVVTVGYLTNLKNLLHLPAANGHASGTDLIRRRVKTWVCMGGNFVGHPPKDDLSLGNVNFQRDALSAFEVIHHWPAPIVFVGREIGSVPSGLQAGADLSKTPPENPVRKAYALFFDGHQKSRHVADLATVLFAVRGLRDYWNMETLGWMDIRPDCTFEWRPDGNKNQAYLLKKQIDGKANDRAIEDILNALLIQRPRRSNTQP